MRTLLLLAATASLLAGSRSTLAQIDVKAMTEMEGQCRAEIEAWTVACQSFGALWEFGNGRLLFTFSREGTLYTFSGSRVQPRSGSGFALTVDTVRIASQTADRNLTDVQGECVVQTEANGGRFRSIECAARSRNASYRFVLDRIAKFERKAFR